MADLLFLSYEVFDFCFLNTELSSSQNDVSGGLLSVDDNLRMSRFPYSTQKSLSDTEINRSSHVSSTKNQVYMLTKGDKLGALLERIKTLLLLIQLHHGPSLPNLFKKAKDSDQEGSSTGAEEETSFGSEYSAGKRVCREYH